MTGLTCDAPAAGLVWDFLLMHHEPQRCDVAIGLGSHDLSVATVAADRYHGGLAPLLVFTGSNSPTTVGQFPEGEAVAYQKHALEQGVPSTDILVEDRARNTGQNIQYSRDLLISARVGVASVLLVSKPYEERRAYATARKMWPEAEFVCASSGESFEEYVARIGDTKLVLDMMVGALQRVLMYPQKGFMIPQHVPPEVVGAFDQLRGEGFTSRLVPD